MTSRRQGVADMLRKATNDDHTMSTALAFHDMVEAVSSGITDEKRRVLFPKLLKKKNCAAQVAAIVGVKDYPVGALVSKQKRAIQHHIDHTVSNEHLDGEDNVF